MAYRTITRRYHMLAFTALLLLIGLAARREPVVRAERIELVNAQGERRALLAADSGGLVLTLLDAQGRPVSSLRLNGEPWLSVQDSRGHEAAGLGSPKPKNLTN
jgi:hypothetical protein